MVKNIEIYRILLEKGLRALENLVSIYASDTKTENDQADIMASDTRGMRDGLKERLSDSNISIDDITVLIVSLRHYIDRHWGDYQEFPLPSKEKHNQIIEQHNELENVIHQMAKFNISLRNK